MTSETRVYPQPQIPDISGIQAGILNGNCRLQIKTHTETLEWSRVSRFNYFCCARCTLCWL